MDQAAAGHVPTLHEGYWGVMVVRKLTAHLIVADGFPGAVRVKPMTVRSTTVTVTSLVSPEMVTG